MREFKPSGLLETAGPGIWDALAGDPTFHFDRRALALLVEDQDRWSHRWLRPPARLLSRVTVALITLMKRALPFQFSNHRLLDRLGIWFLSRFVSEAGGELLLRHFVIETNVLAFIARNSDVDGSAEPTLRPGTLDQLDDNAVIVHDISLYEVLAALGNRPIPKPEERLTPLDYSMLEIGPIDTGRQRRWLRLDLETGMCLMNIAFCLLTTAPEYRRAVHSLQLDESVLGCLAELTGDDMFHTWKPAGYIPIVRTSRDVPRDLFAHAVIHEYIHARLLRHQTPSVAASPNGEVGDTSPNVASLLGEETVASLLGEETCFSPQEGAQATDVGGSAGEAGEGGRPADTLCPCPATARI